MDEGATDSHQLFGQIADAHRHHRDLTGRLVTILSAMHGPAALVWTDVGRPDRQVWLARAGLSPLDHHRARRIGSTHHAAMIETSSTHVHRSVQS